jgi:hypothetical protein
VFLFFLGHDMAVIRIRKNDKPCCLWCDSEKPATKAGWIEHPLGGGEITVYFCSKKCLKAASYKGRGGSLDGRKLAARQRQKERGAMKAQFREILKKDKMDEEDYVPFFMSLSEKQKQQLSYMGYGYLLGKCRGDPRNIIEELNI